MGETLRILNVYAPNGASDNHEFWSLLLFKWESANLPAPDIMLGDTNMVEDKLD